MNIFASYMQLMCNFVRVNSRLLVYFLLVVLVELIVHYAYFNSSSSSVSSDKQKQSTSWQLFDTDFAVNTSLYKLDYKAAEERTQNMRAELDEQSIQLGYKQIAKNARDISTIGKESYKILMYTGQSNSYRFCANNIYLNECPYHNCRFTCDRTSMYDADALIFHETDVYRLDTEETVFLKKTLGHSKSRANQVWILWNDEANPVYDTINAYRFNWTMSYRLDAEIYDCSYGCMYRKTNVDNTPSPEVRDVFMGNLRVEFKKRASRALWFVSNCNANARLQFASTLAKHYGVRMHGKCRLAGNVAGNHEADDAASDGVGTDEHVASQSSLSDSIVDTVKSLIGSGPTNDNCGRNTRCEYDSFKGNKFYLSFESKNCTSYLTEKLWRTLHFHIIPVVFQPSKEHYELFAPPHSFIHAQDFDFDPVRLAAHLKRVSNDFNLYAEYHMWRMNYDVVYSASQCEARRLCQMCTKLNEETSAIHYQKLSNWFGHKCIVN